MKLSMTTWGLGFLKTETCDRCFYLFLAVGAFDVCALRIMGREFVIINYEEWMHPTEIILIAWAILKIHCRIRALRVCFCVIWVSWTNKPTPMCVLHSSEHLKFRDRNDQPWTVAHAESASQHLKPYCQVLQFIILHNSVDSWKKSTEQLPHNLPCLELLPQSPLSIHLPCRLASRQEAI